MPRQHLATALGLMQAAMLGGASLGSIAGVASPDGRRPGQIVLVTRGNGLPD